MKESGTAAPACALIDERIAELGRWRGKALARVRTAPSTRARVR